MISIVIDGIECDTESTKGLKLSFTSLDMARLDSARASKSISVELPSTEQNRTIFGSSEEMHTTERFNRHWHSMQIMADGITMFEGTAYLMELIWRDEALFFRVECRGDVEQWALRAWQTPIAEIPMNAYSTYLNYEGIEDSWQSDSPVKFLPIERDIYKPEPSGSDLTGMQKLRAIDDYHPFINIRSMLESFFEKYGYTIASNFFDTEIFKNLMMSGNYKSKENPTARSKMGFFLKHGNDTSAICNSMGRIVFSAYNPNHSFGNIVDIGTAISDAECYNNSNTVQIDTKEVIFAPRTAVSTGFEYRLHYLTRCHIESRRYMKGIDRLSYANGYTINWRLLNKNADQRGDISGGIEYKVVIFDFDPAMKYRLVARDNSGAELTALNISSRTTSWVPTPEHATESLYYSTDSVNFHPYEGDWAAYYGFVEEEVTAEVDITVRSAPMEFAPNSPMRFELMTMEGGIAGSEATLFADSYVKPYFAYYPVYNQKVWFSEIAQHDFSTLELLEALQHLFDLRVYSDETSRRIFIEPLTDFYTDTEWDWSDKVIASEMVKFSDLAHTAHRSNTLAYQQKDGVVRRLGESDNQEFGRWSYEIDSYAASPAMRSTLNPIFSATVNNDEGALSVGDRDDVATVDSLNISPRIVRYFGMREIGGEQLPYASFHSPSDDSFTLCFEDRDQATGLNRFYTRTQCLEQRSQLINISLQLSAIEYTNLFSPIEGSPSLRDIFTLCIKGETFRCTLYSVEGYDIESEVARCTFLTID